MKQFERRMAVNGLEMRDSSDGVSFTGYASVFNEPYSMGWYTETVDPGAFKRTLGQSPDVRLLINHDGLPLARTASGTLTLDTDSRGLRAQAQLDPTDPDVASLIPKMRRGDLNQMSFGFHTIEDDWNQSMTERSLRALDLDNGDVSIVTFPASPTTVAALRSAGGPNVEAIVAAIRCLEKRDATSEDVVSVLTRALGYFTAIDLVVDAAQDEIAEALGIPNPDEDAPPDSDADDTAREAARRHEFRRRMLALL